MKRAYLAPSLVEYGKMAEITGVFGGPTAGDVLLDENGQVVLAGPLSIDACAEVNEKCVCSDNGTC